MRSITVLTLLLGISIIEDTIAISALAVIQSIASDTVSTGNDITNLGSILQLLISVGVVAAFIGGILVFGSRYLPNLVDKIGKTHDYALL
jgi:Kef-type K+ transport system membrane component KefB